MFLKLQISQFTYTVWTGDELLPFSHSSAGKYRPGVHCIPSLSTGGIKSVFVLCSRQRRLKRRQRISKNFVQRLLKSLYLIQLLRKPLHAFKTFSCALITFLLISWLYGGERPTNLAGVKLKNLLTPSSLGVSAGNNSTNSLMIHTATFSASGLSTSGINTGNGGTPTSAQQPSSSTMAPPQLLAHAISVNSFVNSSVNSSITNTPLTTYPPSSAITSNTNSALLPPLPPAPPLTHTLSSSLSTSNLNLHPHLANSNNHNSNNNSNSTSNHPHHIQGHFHAPGHSGLGTTNSSTHQGSRERSASAPETAS